MVSRYNLVSRTPPTESIKQPIPKKPKLDTTIPSHHTTPTLSPYRHNEHNQTSEEDKIDTTMDSLVGWLSALSITQQTIVKKRVDILIETHKLIELCYSDDDYDSRYASTSIPPEPSVIPLTAEEDERVDRVFRQGQYGLVSKYKSAYVEYKDIYKLYPETWLNDEIINFYFELISDRAIQTSELPSVHCFNTFFCSALTESGYPKVRRWTKKVDIFQKDLLLIPINQSYHWTLGVLDMRHKTAAVYDSLGSHSHRSLLDVFLSYLQSEHQDKKKSDYDLSEWQMMTPKNIPKQKNMSDCGVFTCYYAERISRDHPFDFEQSDMTTLRRRMVLNILDKHL